MNEQTRYRVTGAIFLLALAIIVLPMIFDGAGVRVSQVPAPPAPARTATAVSTAELSIPAAAAIDHVGEIAAAAARVDADGFDTADATRVGDPSLREPRDTEQLAEPAAAVAPQGPAASAATQAIERPAQALAKTPIWAVQLASFASPDNARDFRDTLIKDGYEAWTSTAKRAQSVRTRVAIGPLLDRADANRLRELVSKRYQIEAILVEMGP